MKEILSEVDNAAFESQCAKIDMLKLSYYFLHV